MAQPMNDDVDVATEPEEASPEREYETSYTTLTGTDITTTFRDESRNPREAVFSVSQTLLEEMFRFPPGVYIRDIRNDINTRSLEFIVSGNMLDRVAEGQERPTISVTIETMTDEQLDKDQSIAMQFEGRPGTTVTMEPRYRFRFNEVLDD